MAKFIHTVFFWLREDLTQEDHVAFEEGLKSLKTVKTVEAFHFGKPAQTPREVVDNSFDKALILHFADKAGHDAYQVDEIHDAFVRDHKEKWIRVQVYDTLLQ